MKTNFVLKLILFSFAVILFGCNKNDLGTNPPAGSTTPHVMSSNLDPVTTLKVREYVAITNNEEEAAVTYEYRTLASYSRGANRGIDTTSFTTPDSIRTEGANTVTTVSYTFVYYVRWWYPVSWDDRGFWEVKSRQVQFTPVYLRVQSPQFNSNANAFGDSLTNVQMPANKNMKVSYGVDWSSDDGGKYYYYDLGNEY